MAKKITNEAKSAPESKKATKTLSRSPAKAVVATNRKVAKNISEKLSTATKAAKRRENTKISPAVEPEPTKIGAIKDKAVSSTKKPSTDKKPSPRHFIVDLLLKREYTDEEIHAKVVEQFGEGLYTTKKAYIQLTRADLNAGHIKEPIVDGRMTDYVGKIVLNAETNKKEVQPYKPSALRKTGFQFKLAS